jgi:hypothetical protein
VLGAYRYHASSLMSRNVYWGEIGSEWIHENWRRRLRGQDEIAWETFRADWEKWALWRYPNRDRLARARVRMRECARLLTSKHRFELALNLLGLCVFAPDYLASRILRRCLSRSFTRPVAACDSGPASDQVLDRS